MYENNLKKTAVLNWNLGFEIEFDYEVLEDNGDTVTLTGGDVSVTVLPKNIERMEMSPVQSEGDML